MGHFYSLFYGGMAEKSPANRLTASVSSIGGASGLYFSTSWVGTSLLQDDLRHQGQSSKIHCFLRDAINKVITLWVSYREVISEDGKLWEL